MTTLFVLATRYLSRRKLRTTLTTLAVVLGVAVIFAVNTLIPTMLSALEGTFLGVSGQVDLTVSSASGETFDPGVAAVVSQVQGVAAASPALRRLVVAGTGNQQLEVVGVDLASAQSVRRYQIVAGRFFEGSDSNGALVSEVLAQAGGLRPGSDLSLPALQGVSTLKVVGVLSSTAGERVIVPLATAQKLFGAPGRVNTVDVSIAAGSNRRAVMDALEKSLGPGFR
ncbi:MAG TPA: ABC transporter permease, partial [Chloroflexota bacterium]